MLHSHTLLHSHSTLSPEYYDPLTGLATIHSRDYRLYEQRFLPTMTQEQFINMWRTVYSFFAFETDQEIFTSLSRVGELEREREREIQVQCRYLEYTDHVGQTMQLFPKPKVKVPYIHEHAAFLP